MLCPERQLYYGFALSVYLFLSINTQAHARKKNSWPKFVIRSQRAEYLFVCACVCLFACFVCDVAILDTEPVVPPPKASDF